MKNRKKSILRHLAKTKGHQKFSTTGRFFSGSSIVALVQNANNAHYESAHIPSEKVNHNDPRRVEIQVMKPGDAQKWLSDFGCPSHPSINQSMH